MDVRQGHPGEEHYGDISSVGEWEAGQVLKYARQSGICESSVFFCFSPRHAHGQNKHQEWETRSGCLFSA